MRMLGEITFASEKFLCAPLPRRPGPPTATQIPTMPRSLQSYLPPLHIYRQLLREASYLPPVCQSFARSQIRTRFRVHQSDPPASRAPATRLRLRRARHDLRYLWAANNGLASNMFRILLLAYGRIGKRRRTLMANFVAKEMPVDSAALEAQIRAEVAEAEAEAGRRERKSKKDESGKNCATTRRALRPDWLDAWDLPKLHVLAASQARRSFWSPKPEIKGNKLKPENDIPTENSWGRPLPMKLARSKLRKWYKLLVNRLMPPVARGEWDTLRLLATGQPDRSLWAMPSRRPRAKSWLPGDKEDGEKTWDWRRYATEPVRSIERGSSRSQKARTGEEGEAPYGLGPPIGLQNYDRLRMWQRLYTKVWLMTPTMAESETQKGRWDIHWGQTSREVPVATPMQTAFFEGAVAGKTRRGRRKIK